MASVKCLRVWVVRHRFGPTKGKFTVHFHVGDQMKGTASLYFSATADKVEIADYRSKTGRKVKEDSNERS